MGETVIDIENAVVSYREDVALRGVSLKVQSGEFVGIIGPNGAGKTTMLTIVNGLGKLLSGRVKVLGHYLTAGNGHSLRKKVGYLSPGPANRKNYFQLKWKIQQSLVPRLISSLHPGVIFLPIRLSEYPVQ